MSLLNKVLAANTSIRGASKRTLVRVQRDTLHKARAKCIKKLRQNKDSFNDQSLEKPDPVALPCGTGTYSVGVKYGNRYLQGIFDGGDTFLENVPEEALNDIFDALVEMVEAGECDAALKDAMAANLAMHAKR